MEPYVLTLTLTAIGALFLINQLIGAHEPKRYNNLVEAREEWRILNPDDEPGHGIVSMDGRAALLELQNASSVGLVKSVGDKTATLTISKDTLDSLYLQEVPVNGSYKLKLKLNNPAFPKASIEFPSASSAQDWLKRLSNLAPKSFMP